MYIGEHGFVWLANLFNKILRYTTMLGEGMLNYTGVCLELLIIQGYELIEKVVVHELKEEVSIEDNPFVFMRGRSTIETISFTLD